MKERPDNRRVRMTKRLIKDALLDLLGQTELSRISVTALCAAADVNRSTFYTYYNSPSDLLLEIEEDVLNRIPAPPYPRNPHSEESLLSMTTAFFDYVKEQARVFRILFSNSANGEFASRMVKLLCSQLIVGVEDEDDISSRLLRLYIANGTVGMLKEWIDEDFPISSREIAKKMFYYSTRLTKKAE